MSRRLAAVVVALLLGGCAAIPTSGPVQRVEDESGFGESTVRYSPAGPAPGATEAQIVRGFLDAMLAYPVTHRVASEYLTPQAAERWRPGDRTTVYETAAVDSPGRAQGRAALAVTARLDARGRLTQAAEREVLDLDLERINGQWRIATPPDGVLVSGDWFDDYVRPFEVYFLDATGSRLVPEPVYEVVGDQLATSLMTSLALGPGPENPSGLTTAIPPATELRASVPIVDGAAQVDFSSRVGDLATRQQSRLSAQVAWTLRQVPSVTGVQITGEGTVIAPTGDAVQDASGWTSFGPDKTRHWVTAVVDDHVVQVDGQASERWPGAWGRNAGGAAMVAAAGDRVAAVWADRARVTNAKGGDAVDVSGQRFLRPVVDVEGVVWLIDRTDRSRVRVVRGRQVDLVPTASLPELSSFTLSPDGTRYVATAGGRLLVGDVVRRGTEVARLGPPRDLPTSAPARQAVWIDGTRVAHLGPGRAQVQSVRIDGTDLVDAWPGGGQLLPDLDPTALVATIAPAGDLYLLDGDGRLWTLDQTRWVRLQAATVRGIA